MGVLAVPSHYPEARADVFRCTWTRSGDRSVVYVAGEVDLATAPLIVDGRSADRPGSSVPGEPPAVLSS